MSEAIRARAVVTKAGVARHTRIGKALQHDGRTIILTAPLVGGRALQLVTATP